MRILGNQYYVRRLPADQTPRASGVIVAGEDTEQYDTFEVLSAGPGRILANGRPWPMQAAVGDLVVIESQNQFSPYSGDVADLKAEEGFIHDENLVAVLPAPDFPLLPAGDYVLVRCDRLKLQNETESGLIVATRTLDGAGAREKVTGEGRWRELDEFYNRLSPSLSFAEKEEAVRRWTADLPVWEQDALREAAISHRGGQQRAWEPSLVRPSVKPPGTGVVVAVGPGDVILKGPMTGRRRGRIDLALEPGVKVHMRQALTAVDLWDEGEPLRALKSEYLMAIEETV